jgi:hypothetical protein
MSEAALLVSAMEECRDTAILQLLALDNLRPAVAFAIAAENSVTAKQRWRELNDEAARLTERIALYDAAIVEARSRAARPDYRDQWKTLTGGTI